MIDRKTWLSLFFAFLLAIGYGIFQARFASSPEVFSLLTPVIFLFFIWAVGIIGIVFAKNEKLKLPFFTKPNKTLYLIPLIGLGLSILPFLAAIPFGALDQKGLFATVQRPGGKIGILVVTLLVTYPLASILAGVLFLGEEIYWRGYLWEKLKGGGVLKAIGLIALFWMLWSIPALLYGYTVAGTTFSKVAYDLVCNLLLTPILVYFRLKGKSIFAAAFARSSIMMAFGLLFAFFPSLATDIIHIYGLFILAVLLLFSLWLKLFSSATWKKLL